MAYSADKEPLDLTAKTTPIDADVVIIGDSADASEVAKKTTWANVKATLKTYFDTLYAGVLGADDNYVTDAEKVKLSNLSGTNTGDQTSIVGITGTKAQFDTAVSDGNILYVGDVVGVSDGDKGDITVSASGATWTIDNSTVTLAKQADMATASVVYRKTAGTGVPEVQTLATLKTDLGLTGTNSGDQTSIVGITGTVAQFNTAITDGDLATGGGTATGTNTGDQTTIVGISGTKAQFDTAVSDGNIMFDGDSITNATSTAHRVFYGDGSGVITELALGADGTFLKSNGAAAAPSFAVPAGSGDVSKVGTPVNNQIGVWTGDGTLEGDAALTYDGTNLNLATAKNLQIAGATVLADAAGTTTLSNIDALDATTEATVEAAIDTLANLTSIQGRTVTLVDAGANAIFGWDDVAGAYENLTQGEARTVLGLGTAAYVATDLADLNEATIESSIDTLANLTSVQGLTVTLADAGADAILGWDDSANAYENLTQGEVRAVAGLATTDSPEFTAVNIGHASDTTLARASAGVASIEGNNIVVNTSSPTLATITTTGNIELGHASDTTISRVSAGVAAIEGVNILTTAGGTLTGNLTLGENTSIDLDPAGSADGKYSGICITGTAGATLAFGDLIYLAVADSRWELTDADATATAGTPLIGMCVLAAAADGNATKILLQGTIRADAKFPALTIGAPAYVGETAGAIQTAIPTGADNVIRVVGRALTADELYFCPSQDHQITVA